MMHRQVFGVRRRSDGAKLVARDCTNDIYGPNALGERNGFPGDHDMIVQAFETMALDVFERLVRSGELARVLRSAGLRAGDGTTPGATPSREKRLDIMRAIYDDQHGWPFVYMSQELNYECDGIDKCVTDPKAITPEEREAWTSATLVLPAIPASRGQEDLPLSPEGGQYYRQPAIERRPDTP